MKKPSLWKQIADENAAFVGQFDSEVTFEKAGLTSAEQRLVLDKRQANKLHGVTLALDKWQVRFTINGRQEILFVSGSLVVAALMRDLLLTVLLKYPHCCKRQVGNPVVIDPAKENGIFNLPLCARERYAVFGFGPGSKEVMNFVGRVEKLLLDKGILYPITPEEAAERALVSSKEPSAQLRYQKRRSTQLEQALEQIQTMGNSCQKMAELCARHVDLAEKSDAKIEILSQQVEFSTSQFESLKLAVGTLTATFRELIDQARKTT